jgi:hypothetical protein
MMPYERFEAWKTAHGLALEISLAELSYLLHFSKDRGIIDEDTFRRLSELRHQVGKLSWGRYVSLGPEKRH